ncbi:MAG TPA: amidohydrolase family protein [Chloroflexota bacterium]|nr:amidohydrolase family protein [Chloroflexota bacterium]
MIVDLHTHIVPQHFPKSSADRWPSMAHLEPGKANVTIDGNNFRTVRDVCWSHTLRSKEMQSEGADAQVISPMPELLSYWFKPQDGLDMSRHTNDHIASMCQAEPERFYGMGMVPLQDPELAAKELAPMKRAGLLGVELGSNILGKSLGEEQFLPFFQEADKQGMAIFVHALHPTFNDRYLANERTINAIGFPTEGGLNIGSMLVSGMLHKCPTLRLAFSHGGGTFPFFLPRLENSWSGQWNGEPPAEGAAPSLLRQMLPKSPTQYARQFYYDTLLFDRRAIRYLIDLVGASQVTVGTDYPFFPREQPVGKTLRETVSNADWDLVSHKNALKFLGL